MWTCPDPSCGKKNQEDRMDCAQCKLARKQPTSKKS